MYLRELINAPLIISSCALLLAIGTGCGDDDNGDSSGNGDQPGGETLELSGDVSGHYDGEGEELYSTVGFEDVGQGTLESDGTFSVTLTMTSEIYEDELEPPASSVLDGFRGLVCIEEFLEEIEDARFLRVSNFSFLTESEEGTQYPRLLELSTETEGQTGSSLAPFPNVGQVYVTWLYSTDSFHLQETCDEGEIDVELDEGWNEVMIDTTNASGADSEIIQWTGERPDEVDWYLEPEGTGLED